MYNLVIPLSWSFEVSVESYFNEAFRCWSTEPATKSNLSNINVTVMHFSKLPMAKCPVVGLSSKYVQIYTDVKIVT